MLLDHYNLEGHIKKKRMRLTVDGDFSWVSEKVYLSRKNKVVRIEIDVKKDDVLFTKLKSGKKLEVEIGKMPIREYSLNGASEALATAERRCGIMLGADDLLK